MTTGIEKRNAPDYFPLDLAMMGAVTAGAGAIIGVAAMNVLAFAATSFLMIALWRARVRRGDFR